MHRSKLALPPFPPRLFSIIRTISILTVSTHARVGDGVCISLLTWKPSPAHLTIRIFAGLTIFPTTPFKTPGTAANLRILETTSEPPAQDVRSDQPAWAAVLFVLRLWFAAVRRRRCNHERYKKNSQILQSACGYMGNVSWFEVLPIAYLLFSVSGSRSILYRRWRSNSNYQK